jgi:DNA-binding CsgD family transcriptional regulator
MPDVTSNPQKRTAEHLTDDRRERRLALGVGVVFVGLTLLMVLDIAFDYREAISLKHRIVGFAEILIGLAGIAITGRRLFTSLKREGMLRREVDVAASRWRSRESELKSEAEALAQQLKVTEQEAYRWKREAGGLLAGLGGAIDTQFSRWTLTPAEREVALLLLKGLSHKEIASVRGVGEATVRQQAQAIYRKAGLSSRNDLAAFFLEDLLLPNEQAHTSAAGIQ